MGAGVYNIEPQQKEGLHRHTTPRSPLILVVDDETAVLEVIKEILADEGFAVITATDGRSALALAADVQPDLVITDLMMPGMNGRSLCEHLARDPHTKRTPVMLMSAAYRPQSGDKFAAVIDKPFELDELLDVVEQQIAEHSSR